MYDNPRATMTRFQLASGFSLWRSAMRWQRSLNEALRPLELTHTQFLLLSCAVRAQEHAQDTVTQRAIAQEAGLDEATTSRVVRALEERGLLDRGPTFGDQRAWRVIVTDKGRRLLKTATPLAERAARRFSSDPA
jgi:DNA-binding MarR family transcriptional regulator